MEESFFNLYQNDFLFVSVHLSTVCDYSNNSQDLARGKLLLFIGILFLSLYSMCIWCYVPRQRSDNSSERSGVQLTMTAISFSLVANGIALVGRWFVPRDNVTWLTVGAGTMFSIGVVLFCCYKFSSGKFKKT
ncbi:hypothetical protein GQ457_13G029800 [Hibiscus cannabinus]